MLPESYLGNNSIGLQVHTAEGRCRSNLPSTLVNVKVAKQPSAQHRDVKRPIVGLHRHYNSLCECSDLVDLASDADQRLC